MPAMLFGIKCKKKVLAKQNNAKKSASTIGKSLGVRLCHLLLLSFYIINYCLHEHRVIEHVSLFAEPNDLLLMEKLPLSRMAKKILQLFQLIC